MPFGLGSLRRLFLGAFVLGLAAPAMAQIPLQQVGVISLLGENLQIVSAADVTDTRIDRNLHESLPIKDIGFDTAALRGVRDSVAFLRPDAKIHMYKAPQPLTALQQREIAYGAARGELPGWIVGAIQSAKLSHVLLISQHFGEASFAMEDGHSIGRGTVIGVGYYIDKITEVKDPRTQVTSRGFLGQYAYLRLTLMDTRSAEVVAGYDIRASRAVGAKSGSAATEPWDFLTPQEKIEQLRQMVQQNVARAMTPLLANR